MYGRMKMQENDNTEQEHGADWIDFKALKATLEVRPVLAHFGILQHLEIRRKKGA